MISRIMLFIEIILLSIPTWASKPNVEKAFPNLQFSRPVFITHSGDGTNRLFIVEKRGRIQVIPNDSNVTEKTEFLNIVDRVRSEESELGLLGLAFHPNFKDNRYFYVNYTTGYPDHRRTYISRFRASNSNPNYANPNTEVVLFKFDQPYDNHNGGMLAFGPDGYLYIGVGDGGSGGDPHNNAQNLYRVLGKILRIDVDNPNSEKSKPYSIPADNPLADNTEGYDEEIWAWGMRNPWRFSFDPVTGLLYCGDVGQGEYEEVDIIYGGKNYGWNAFEGNHWYVYRDTTGFNITMPVKEYSHSKGNSITGGYVYYGQSQPALLGAYIYGDYGRGKIWMLRYENGQVIQDESLIGTGVNISSFGVDENQELYFCDYSYGWIWKFENVNHPPESGSLQMPPDNSMLDSLNNPVLFVWQPFSDVDGDTLTYFLHLYSQQSDTTIETSTDTSYSLANEWLDFENEYFWYISATDPNNNVAVSDTFAFQTQVQPNVPPEPVTLLKPADSNTISGDIETIIFSWTSGIDVNEDTLHYSLHLTGDQMDTTYQVGVDTTFLWFDHVPSDTYQLYSWQVWVSDGTFQTVSETFTFLLLPPSAVQKPHGHFPSELTLFHNYPNPFNPATNIHFWLPKAGHVELSIYNLQGQLVKRLMHEMLPGGSHQVVWHGTDSAGNRQGTGLYIAELIFNNQRRHQRLLMIK